MPTIVMKVTLLLVLSTLKLTCAFVPAFRLPRISNSKTATMVVPAAPLPVFPEPAVHDETKSWRSRLGRVSVVASVLCAIDCTVLPALLVLVPALNIAGVSSAGLHKITHLAAVWFVAPVGGAALTANWIAHRRNWVGAWGLSGLFLVLMANLHLPHGLLPHAVDHFVHTFHTLISLAGCALLLSSQWYSSRLHREAGKCCGHEH
jgi:hypothetical protein